MRKRAWGSFLAGVVACILFWGSWWLFGLSVIAALGVFWSLGVVSNCALRAEVYWRENLLRNMRSEGYSEDEIKQRLASVPVDYNPDLVPNWPVLINLLFSIACVGLLIVGVVIKL